MITRAQPTNKTPDTGDSERADSAPLVLSQDELTLVVLALGTLVTGIQAPPAEGGPAFDRAAARAVAARLHARLDSSGRAEVLRWAKREPAAA